MFIGMILIPSPKDLFHLYFFKRGGLIFLINIGVLSVYRVCLVFSEVKKKIKLPGTGIRESCKKRSTFPSEMLVKENSN